MGLSSVEGVRAAGTEVVWRGGVGNRSDMSTSGTSSYERSLRARGVRERHSETNTSVWATQRTVWPNRAQRYSKDKSGGAIRAFGICTDWRCKQEGGVLGGERRRGKTGKRSSESKRNTQASQVPHTENIPDHTWLSSAEAEQPRLRCC